MHENNYGQGRMVIHICENLQPPIIKRFLEKLAIKINGGGIISPVSFMPLDSSGKTLEARGPIKKLIEITSIISGSVFLEDRICLFGAEANEATDYFSFASDYFNSRTGSVGFYEDYFPGFIKIRKGATYLEEVMRAFRGIIIDIPEVITTDGSGQIVLLQQEINEDNFVEEKSPSEQFQNTEKLIA